MSFEGKTHSPESRRLMSDLRQKSFADPEVRADFIERQRQGRMAADRERLAARLKAKYADKVGDA